jgi:predicted dehydrogenase
MQKLVNPEAGARDVSRREFITSSAVAAASAGIVLGARAEDAKAVPAADKIHVALIGYGAEGRVLMESLLKITTIKLVAIVDVWKYARDYGQRYLDKQGVKVNAYENYEELLKNEKDLQAVVVATPDFWHAPITNACLKAGLHVYCEKMMSNTLDGAKSMVKAMQETGKLLQIGHQRRSNPRYLFTLNRLIRERQICGRITVANAQWNRAVAEDLTAPKHSEMTDAQLKQYGFDDMHQFRNWRWYKKYGGGPLSDLGAHQIDIFNWWLDTHPTNVIAAGGLDYYSNRDWFDNAMVVYEYAVPLLDSKGEAVKDAAGKPSTYNMRAFYQVQTTTSAGGGYWEYFMGTQGSVKMSENPKLGAVFKEANANAALWDDMVASNYIRPKAEPPPAEGAKVDVRETAQLAAYEIPVTFNKPPHMPHLENFFNAVLTKNLADTDPKKVKLNCPADEAYKSETIIFKAIDAIYAKKMLDFTPADFEV